MQDAVLDFATVSWTHQKDAVRVFYKEMWDKADVSLVPRLFHPDFTFRGSLGPELIGHDQFIGYVRFVTGSLGSYTSDFLAIAEDGDRVFAKLRFHGIHQAELLGIAPTGRHVWWYGMPIFTFDGPLIRDLWVLGDLYSLSGRLRGDRETKS